ncbi:MaoC domain protein dehydratase [Kineococcus radiotolerans SRS30216 = ATCC BAA-149]|uniref:MaoC domain protein dehydratase n=2 Tax=Kineococcus radiotolerans TaxID=131568 RepID=A6WFA0_KINRD|nr:MaoC domain protein dehydratase [Kineococcus radiotolerans SRS30216 = ATCC BAA-149]
MRPEPAGGVMERELTAAPSLPRLYARSLVQRPHRGVDFPRTRVVLRGAGFDADRVAAFCRSTGFPVRDTVPLPFPHLLGFGLQVDLLVREPFPFTLLGLVHVAQTFEQTRPLGVGEAFDVGVRAVGVNAHRRGATVDLLTELRTDGTTVWTGRSRYLARGVPWPGRPVEPAHLPAPEGEGTRWRVPADAGRAYAAVSGDVNPIHLSPLTARLLGFRRALAHGMWTASRSLAALGGPAPGAARFEVEFAKPLLLPATVRHVARPGPDGWSTAVRSRNGATLHLAGRLTDLVRP